MQDTSESLILQIIEEQDRGDKNIGSLIYSRAVIFHPTNRLTNIMKARLKEVAEAGGSQMSLPLARSESQINGERVTIDLHGNYLLHSHREILEAILAHSDLVRLYPDDYDAGLKMGWNDVFRAVNSKEISGKSSNDTLDESDGMVLSIGMYDLALKLGMTPHRKNYERIRDKLLQVQLSSLMVYKYSEGGEVSEASSLKFIKDLKFVFDTSKKNFSKIQTSNDCNHILLVPDNSLLEMIRDHGYFKRSDQEKIPNYNGDLIKSFIKWVKTHKATFINTKKLTWAIDQYINSLATPTNKNTHSRLENELLKCSEQIAKDFNIHIRLNADDEYQIFAAEEVKI